MPQLPFVSIIVPAYNDAERLGVCLDALREQSYPADRFEIIVADNGSEPPLETLLRRDARVRFVREVAPGSYAARNAGVRESRGEVLAFTDSDCRPDRDWLRAGVNALGALPEGGLVGGRVELYVRDRARPSAVELYEMVLAFPQERYVRQSRFAVTANVFTTRRTFERVGPFNATLISGGDNEWGKRVHAAGLPVVYAHDAVVHHPARRSMAEISRKMDRVAEGHSALGWESNVADWLRLVAPPVSNLVEIWSSKRLSSVAERSRASAVAIAAKYRWTLARLRLRLRPARISSGGTAP